MRFLGVLATVVMISRMALATSVVSCETAIEMAEKDPNSSVYEQCGFNDADLAWNQWAGFVSQKEFKRALYELCVRWPDHMYSDLYCEKSANLGYAPAIAEQGHRLMYKGMSQSAVSHYTRALQTGGLSDEQEGKIAEQLGLYYLNPNAQNYAPAKAVAFLQEASKKRSALANNTLGYLYYTGELGVSQSHEEAFKYFWRAILLGCPAAEENLGLFHLARLQQVQPETALRYMQKTAYTCTGVSESNTPELKKPIGCECADALQQAQKYLEKPYIFVETWGKTARIKDKNANELTVSLNQKLPTGYTVTDIRPTAVILQKGKERVILNKITNLPCIQYCESVAVDGAPGEEIHIKPYRLIFTPNECQDLLYYAPALVDVSKPFVGQKECAGGMMGQVDPLLELMKKDEQKKPSKVRSQKKKGLGVQGRIGVNPSQESEQTQIAPETVKSETERKAVSVGAKTRTVSKNPKAPTNEGKKRLDPRYLDTNKYSRPKKEIRFTVGGGALSKE